MVDEVFSVRRFAVLLVVMMVAVAALDACGEEPKVESLIQMAGNADTDEERLAHLKKLAELPGISEALKGDAERLCAAIDQWLTNPRIDYFGNTVVKGKEYDLGVGPDSVLNPIAEIYRARMLFWVTLEYGGLWSFPDTRRAQFDKIRPMLERTRERFPENRLVRMYLGEPFPPTKDYPAVEGAPAWAVAQREGLERLADIVTWWIDYRMQENGEYGGGWGDDCEMWRSWASVLIAFKDPKIEGAQARFSEALLSQKHMRGGYTDHVFDVEHTAEDSSDAITPMMHLEPDSEAWAARALRLVELMETLWTGVNERGQLQFKSTYFSSERVDGDPRKACDTVYHAKAVQPALLYWQRTGDPHLTELFSRWMDTWVEAAACEERGKPAGIVPSAIHWPDGTVGGLGKHWWDPENHSKDPLYVWPSAMSQMLPTLLLTYHMTQDEKYLAPIKSMIEARLEYLKHPPEKAPEPGTKGWCAARYGGLRDVAAKYRVLTGRTDFDEFLAMDSSPYMTFRLRADNEPMVRALETNAHALRINFPGFTSEVRYTDRVFRFPAVFQTNGMYPDGLPGIPMPQLDTLYATATGDPGDVGYCPVGAVRWLTPPRDIAALVTDSGTSRFEAEVFCFGQDGPRSMGAEFYLLAKGEYVLVLETKADGRELKRHPFSVSGQRTRVPFDVPARQLCVIRIEADSK